MFILCCSFGIVLWEVATRRLPYDNIRFNSEIEDRVKAGHRERIPDDVSSEYGALIEACWHQNPARRPSMDDVVRMLTMLNGACSSHRTAAATMASSAVSESVVQNDVMAERQPLIINASSE